jgi:hypothetical protein
MATLMGSVDIENIPNMNSTIMDQMSTVTTGFKLEPLGSVTPNGNLLVKPSEESKAWANQT